MRPGKFGGRRPRAEGSAGGRIEMRVTAEERERLRAAAESSGLTVSDYIRRAALAPRMPLLGREDRTALIDLTGQMRRSGNNLNTWLRAAHLAARGFAPADGVRDRLIAAGEEIERIVASVREVLANLEHRRR